MARHRSLLAFVIVLLSACVMGRVHRRSKTPLPSLNPSFWTTRRHLPCTIRLFRPCPRKHRRRLKHSRQKLDDHTPKPPNYSPPRQKPAATGGDHCLSSANQLEVLLHGRTFHDPPTSSGNGHGCEA